MEVRLDRARRGNGMAAAAGIRLTGVQQLAEGLRFQDLGPPRELGNKRLEREKKKTVRADGGELAIHKQKEKLAIAKTLSLVCVFNWGTGGGRSHIHSSR